MVTNTIKLLNTLNYPPLFNIPQNLWIEWIDSPFNESLFHIEHYALGESRIYVYDSIWAKTIYIIIAKYVKGDTYVPHKIIINGILLEYKVDGKKIEYLNIDKILLLEAAKAAHWPRKKSRLEIIIDEEKSQDYDHLQLFATNKTLWTTE